MTELFRIQTLKFQSMANSSELTELPSATRYKFSYFPELNLNWGHATMMHIRM